MESFSGLTWNVRGCNNIKSRRNIRSHVTTNNINFLCLQETKCKHWEKSKGNSIWDGDTHGWLTAPSIGSSGGLATSWDKSLFKMSRHIVTNNWILFQGLTQQTNQQFICINVYAPQSTTDKTLLWDQISSLVSTNMDTALCILGDFNSVRSSSDRLNCMSFQV